jgi:hypothetical protein
LNKNDFLNLNGKITNLQKIKEIYEELYKLIKCYPRYINKLRTVLHEKDQLMKTKIEKLIVIFYFFKIFLKIFFYQKIINTIVSQKTTTSSSYDPKTTTTSSFDPKTTTSSSYDPKTTSSSFDPKTTPLFFFL